MVLVFINSLSAVTMQFNLVVQVRTQWGVGVGHPDAILVQPELEQW